MFFYELRLPRLNHFKIGLKIFGYCNGVAIESPLGPIVAKTFMCHFKNTLWEKYPSNFKPITCRRFADVKFSLFRWKDQIEKLRDCLNK